MNKIDLNIVSIEIMEVIKMKKIIGLVSICFLLFMGCSKDKSENSVKKEGKKTVIQVAVSGSYEEIDIRKHIGELYMQKNPEVELEWIDLGGERYQKLLTLIGGGNAPDLLYVNEWTVALAERNVLEPLDDYIAQDTDFNIDDFYESLLPQATYEGKIYSIPQEVSPYVIYYNKDMFDRAGVEYPTMDWEVEEFFEKAKQLTDPEKKEFGYQHYIGWQDQWMQWINRAGMHELFTSDLKSTNYGTPEALAGLRVLRRMTVEDKISPNPASISAMGKSFDGLFRNQKVAMFASGLWILPPFDKDPLDFKWDIVKVPKDINRDTKAGILNWAISSNSKLKEESWDVLKFFVSKDGMSEIAASRIAMPSVKTDTDYYIELMREKKSSPENIQVFYEVAPDVNTLDMVSSKREELTSLVDPEISKLEMGVTTPEEAQERIVQIANEFMNE